MTFLIKIDYPLLDFINTQSLSVYIAIKKRNNLNHITNGQTHSVEIYSSIENGIIARGIIKQGAIRVRDIPKNEHQYIKDKSFLQVEIFLNNYAEKRSLLGNEIFEIVPAVNHFKKIRPYNPFTLYIAGDLANEINIFFKKKVTDLNFIENLKTRTFRVKLLKERAKYVFRKKLNYHRNKNNKTNNCDICFTEGFSHYQENGCTLYPLEKTLTFNLLKYQKMEFENIMVLCSKCFNYEIKKVR